MPTGPAKPTGAPVTSLDGGRIGQLDLGGAAARRIFPSLASWSPREQHGDRLAVGEVDERLDHVLRPAAQQLAHLLDGGGARRGHLGQRLPQGVGRDQVAAADLRPFLVGRIAAAPAMEHDVLAVLGGDHEFMAGVAADGTAFGLHRQVAQPAAVENAAVGRVHLLVAVVEGLDRHVEAVGVLHEEFAGAQHAERGRSSLRNLVCTW